ncbi:unnamed protein product [Arabidopsis thaliana]|uniref:(thale cress) hypothetical protein n=1 Tax=Arabidopsis thaliana TaxID=3702 RepID=A0A7G2E1M3_ARATH|nr:unnamed protein product [Arabidopsis thaliana]
MKTLDFLQPDSEPRASRIHIQPVAVYRFSNELGSQRRKQTCGITSKICRIPRKWTSKTAER